MVERLGVLLGLALVSSCGIANGLSGGQQRSPFADLFDGPPGDGGEGGRCNGGDVVLTTDDGVELNALWAPEGIAAIVLVHQFSGDRTNWSPDAFSFFQDQGYSVLSIDRRNVGRDGPQGALDVKAAHEFLLECEISHWGAVGASTGTAPIYDYLLAPIPFDPGARLQAAVFLSPGPWTDANNPTVADHVSILDSVAGFSAITDPDCCAGAQLAPMPSRWGAHSYPQADGDFHGEQMLENAALQADLSAFLGVELVP